MSTKQQAVGDILLELEELKKVDVRPEEEGPYSYTYEYGSFLTLLCC